MKIDKLRFKVYCELVESSKILAQDIPERFVEIEQPLDRIEEHIRGAECRVAVVSSSGHFADLLMNRFTGMESSPFIKLHNIHLLRTTAGNVQNLSEAAEKPDIYIFEAAATEINDTYLNCAAQVRESCPQAEIILLPDTDLQDEAMPICEDQMDWLKKNRISVWTYSSALAIRGQQLYHSKMLASSGFRNAKILLIDTIEIARRKQLVHCFMEYDSILHGIWEQFTQKIRDGERLSAHYCTVRDRIKNVPAAFDDVTKNWCVEMSNQICPKCLQEISFAGSVVPDTRLSEAISALDEKIWMILVQKVWLPLYQGRKAEICRQEAAFVEKLMQILKQDSSDFPALKTVCEQRLGTLQTEDAVFTMPPFQLQNKNFYAWDQAAELDQKEKSLVLGTTNCLQAYQVELCTQLENWLISREERLKVLQDTIVEDITREIKKNEDALQQITGSAAFQHVSELILSASALKEEVENPKG